MTDQDKPSREQRGARRAQSAGLVYINGSEKGYGRRRCGRGFTFLSIRGKILRSPRTRTRIKALAIPPAWQDVWICPDARGHIQATGRDEAGRKQYIYHERWLAISTATKFDRMVLFGRLLPRIRKAIRRDLRRHGLGRRRVLAAVVGLVDRGHLRVGNERYTQTHGSRGVTTLDADNVDLDGISISFEFKGKSGQQREVEVNDEQLAKVVRQCEDIDSQFLFCYRESTNSDSTIFRTIESGDVNEWLRGAASERVTAKDFRTWWGSVRALSALVPGLTADRTKKERAAVVREAIAETAELLGNTAAVCRSSYIHPAILAAATNGELPGLLSRLPDEERGGDAFLASDERRFRDLLPLLMD